MNEPDLTREQIEKLRAEFQHELRLSPRSFDYERRMTLCDMALRASEARAQAPIEGLGVQIRKEVRTTYSSGKTTVCVEGMRGPDGSTDGSWGIENSWIPVSERLPEDRQEVRFVPLSGNAMNGWYEAPQAGFANGKFFRGDGLTRAKPWGSYTRSAVTHWMPLPEPPMIDAAIREQKQ